MPAEGQVNSEGVIFIEGGWTQVYDRAELQSFVIGVAATLLLAALITFHPVRLAARRATEDFVMPHLFMLYALIGMGVGFLVIQHGYIIGFVVFGIGALLRFRSSLDDPVDTVEMILVTVLGLCVGLNLPIMAILIGVVGWVLIWATGRRTPVELKLQAENQDALQSAIDHVHQIIGAQGWKRSYFHQPHGKTNAKMILLVPVQIGLEGAEDVLSKDLQIDGFSWKISS